mmetsp:Transcript_1509/g.1005  ORF Transcript_1509/g.1005 Transcript_1509/m.1005 type:complete len:118 (+) Transcript_1509:201-554(+)|eukprot:CAMPEP_0116881384 /NCGR_PEP_ID=MMETSP0463-20121206/13501_1 /TAXON_ID=181622 /ORGANISM="Strombidinopsis sp, Strain SopsisLIS2011" /LENGTH=117 /DNA_ID=CAMNT_0004533285 /DNA_START=168 /DNA_END=521 /DNA_ORIENTATION=-
MATDRFNETLKPIEKGWIGYLDALKDYFDVTNSYVLKKLRAIILPFTIKKDDWKRQYSGCEFQDEVLTPRSDLQAPDLYIPTMAFVTFILLTGANQAMGSIPLFGGATVPDGDASSD